MLSGCPHYLAWHRDCLLTAVLIGRGGVDPIRGCAVIELCTLLEREFSVCFPSFPVPLEKEVELDDQTTDEVND